MIREWFTLVAGPTVKFGVFPQPSYWYEDNGIGGFRPRSGDTVTHFLMDWWFATDLYLNSDNLEKTPFPLVVGASYSPENNGLASWTPQGDNGEALMTAQGTWEARPWTDGTLHSTQWITRSLVPMYSNTSRDIHDKETDFIRLGAGLMSPDGWGGTDGDWFQPLVTGWIRLRFLVLEKQFS